MKGLFSEPRRGDDSCGRASQASAGAFSDRAGLLYAIFRRVSVLSWFSRNQDSVVHFETHGCEDRFSRKVDFQPALDPRARARAANSQDLLGDVGGDVASATASSEELRWVTCPLA